jgi:transcription antitermination factor NusG
VTQPQVSLAAGDPWFAVYTTCRHEKRVALHMQQREIEHYLPLYVTKRKWRDGSKVVLELPLFPCYIFVRMQRSERARVLSIPGALAVVNGTGGDAAPVPDSAILALREGIATGKVEPHSLLTVGQRVRIHSGPFAGMFGVVTRKKSSFRVVLTLQQIMQSVAVEVDEDQVEILGEEAAHAHLAGASAVLHWQHA